MPYWNVFLSLHRRTTLWFVQCSANTALRTQFWIIKSSKHARNLFTLCKQCYLVLISLGRVNINLTLTLAYPLLLSLKAHWFTSCVNIGCFQTNRSWSSLHSDEASFAITHQIPWPSTSSDQFMVCFFFFFGSFTTLLVCFSSSAAMPGRRKTQFFFVSPLGSQHGWLQGII